MRCVECRLQTGSKQSGGSVECEVNRRNAVIGHRRDNNGEWSKSIRNKIA